MSAFNPNESFPWESTPAPGGARGHAGSHGSVADPVLAHPHRPFPDPATGTLLVDPDITLKAKGFDLEINLFYNSRSNANGAYGKKRSISTNAYVLKILSDFGNKAQLVRGDEKVYEFNEGSTTGGVTTYNGSNTQYSGTKLVWDSNTSEWIETFPDGKQIIYDVSLGGSPERWNIGRIEDPSGNIHTYSYGAGSEAGLLKTVEVPGGRVVTFNYEPGGSPTSLLHEIQDWGGRIWTMAYDVNRELTTLTTPLGCATKYAYSSGKLSTIEDPRGYRSTYAFDGNGRITSVASGSGVWTYVYGGPMTWSGSARQDPSGAITTYLLDSNGRIEFTDHPEGYRTTLVYSTRGYIAKEIQPYGTVLSATYDDFGRPLVVFDALGNVTTNQYDASGNLTTLIDALGNVHSFTYDGDRRLTCRIDPLGRRTTHAWNSDGTLLAQQDGRGLRTTHAYDAFGNLASTLFSDGGVVTYGWDNLGRRTSVQQPGDSVARSFVYDAGDHLIASVDLDGSRTTYVWDSCMMVAVANPLNERTTFTYNRFGSRETVMNPLGAVSTQVYDSMNRPLATVDALGNRTTNVYTGNLKTAEMDALGNLTSFVYDVAARLTTVIDARGNAWVNVYDARNLVARIDPLGNRSTTIYDALNRQVAGISPLGLRTTSVYDAAGQLSATVDAMGFRTTFQYDNAGNRTSVEDANGKLTTTVYFSNRNQAQATVDAMGFRTSYAYDLQGRLQSTQDANGDFVTNVYDSMGRLQFVKNALGENARQYGYDLAGRMVTYADAANRVRTYTYDQAGQNTAIQFPDGRIATHAYDALGRRTTMSDWGGISTYAFDARGQMSGKTASGYVQAYGYDANGNRTTLTLAGVGTITSVFDTLNRLTSAQKPTGELYTMMYDVDSRRTTMQLGNGTTRAYAYDANSRLTTQIELSGATRLVTIVDSYDPVGNRIGRNLDGVLTTWTYDDLYRLTHQDKPGQVCTYVLDPVGNLEVMWEGGAAPKTFTFDAADRLVTMVEGSQTTTYTYTAFGALETEVTTGVRVTNTYDGMDQLIKVHRTVLATPFISTYTFDGDGLRRTTQEGNVQPTTMIWDGSDYLFLDGPSSDQLVLTLGGEVVASGSRDLLTDPLGSLVREITAGATLSGQFDLYPYGRLVAGSPTPATPFVYVAAYGIYRDTADRVLAFGNELSLLLGRPYQSGNLGGKNDNPWGLPKPPTVGDLLPPPPFGPQLPPVRVAIPANLMPTRRSECKPDWDLLGPCLFAIGLLPGLGWLAWCHACLKQHHDSTWNETNLPGYSEAERNALRHCVGACHACRSCGCTCALLLDLRESKQWWFGDDDLKEDSFLDLHNNQMGRAFGCSKDKRLKSISCLEGCKWLLREGILDV